MQAVKCKFETIKPTPFGSWIWARLIVAASQCRTELTRVNPTQKHERNFPTTAKKKEKSSWGIELKSHSCKININNNNNVVKSVLNESNKCEKENTDRQQKIRELIDERREKINLMMKLKTRRWSSFKNRRAFNFNFNFNVMRWWLNRDIWMNPKLVN